MENERDISLDHFPFHWAGIKFILVCSAGLILKRLNPQCSDLMVIALILFAISVNIAGYTVLDISDKVDNRITSLQYLMISTQIVLVTMMSSFCSDLAILLAFMFGTVPILLPFALIRYNFKVSNYTKLLFPILLISIVSWTIASLSGNPISSPLLIPSLFIFTMFISVEGSRPINATVRSTQLLTHATATFTLSLCSFK